MKRNFAAVLVFIAVSLFAAPVMAADNLILGDDLSISVFCAEYEGNRYDFVLRYAPEAEPGEPFWKMDISTLQPAQDECQPLPMGNDLSLDVTVSFQECGSGSNSFCGSFQYAQRFFHQFQIVQT